MCFRAEANLEMADEMGFRLVCDCGWGGEVTGFTAIRHWVHAWETVRTQRAEVVRSGKEVA